MTIRTCLLALGLAVSLGGAGLAEPAYVFGPGPRALDNRAVFGAEARPAWHALRQAGVEGIVLNPTFLMETEFQRGPTPEGRYPRRPEGTYLTDADLEGLARTVARTGLGVTYEAGIGLSGEACDPRLPPAGIGRRAAQVEFGQTVSRLMQAGIPVAAINVDGPFLRLIADSRKAWSCAAFGTTPEGKAMRARGFDPDTAARAAQAYMKEMRDLIAAAGGGDTRVNLLINLPNWQVQSIPRLGNRKGAATTDLTLMFQAFTRMQKADADPGPPLEIAEIVIDYPYYIVRADSNRFRDRTKHLWNMSRGINPGGAPPVFGFIVNSGDAAHACLGREAATDVPFLPFRRGAGAISEKCQRAQTGSDTAQNARDGVSDNDVDFLRDSLTYAEALRPGGKLARELVTRDGSRIADHVGHIYFQAWGVNPLSNRWYMERLAGYLDAR